MSILLMGPHSFLRQINSILEQVGHLLPKL
uniref:Uncharacterized protein n=1 Tax=Podoviridae sp. cttxo15 TaxID=2826584 RepID=A0A8S5N2G1_9CAUD|nr:MAG TPA: hypothetical protein [Podoviridae sp. cttxo15]